MTEQDRHAALWDCIVGRRSVRRMQERNVSRGDLEALVEAAAWSPSPHKAQPWRFALVDERRRLQRLAGEMAAAFRADLERDAVEPATIERLCGESVERFGSAPAMLVPCLTMEEMRRYPDARRRRAEEEMAIMSAGAALQNLMLRAHALGLATCWYSAPLFCQEVVRRALDLPAGWQPLAIVIVGYAAVSPPLPPRREFQSLLRYAEAANA
ncbi:MAG: nitroreductase family protein [Candidatus Tectomicrobia bacterium]|nr:nitroreductase family protein [Candidatus Tectomicrobia bacterium]